VNKRVQAFKNELIGDPSPAEALTSIFPPGISPTNEMSALPVGTASPTEPSFLSEIRYFLGLIFFRAFLETQEIPSII